MRKGKLRLDLKDKAFAGREGKHVIAPGDLEGSLAWERMTTDDDDERMPPEGKGEPLTKKQIATLKTWIEQGARWEDHWSFLPPRKPALPDGLRPSVGARSARRLRARAAGSRAPQAGNRKRLAKRGFAARALTSRDFRRPPRRSTSS